jgi:hypothetical protein
MTGSVDFEASTNNGSLIENSLLEVAASVLAPAPVHGFAVVGPVHSAVFEQGQGQRADHCVLVYCRVHDLLVGQTALPVAACVANSSVVLDLQLGH